MNQITKIGVVRVTLERKNSKKPFSPEKAVRLYSRMSDTTQRPENWLFQIIPSFGLGDCVILFGGLLQCWE